MTKDDSISITALDLEGLLPWASDPALLTELRRATLVGSPTIPKDLATMNSRVIYEDESTGERGEVTIVYPHHAEASEGRISVLSPLGMALLGLREGQSIDWPLANGQRRRIRLLEVVDNPASGGRKKPRR